ncbi:hypothetical protein M8J77_018393 [Diaphorina citri]|nr:hypothetical protein M8J77_018393 [Diaphorina citri]
MTSLGLLDKFSIFVVICVVLLTNEKSVTSQHAVKQPPHRLEARPTFILAENRLLITTTSLSPSYKKPSDFGPS